MIRLQLKPVSTNRLYSGRRYLSQEARVFQEQCHLLLLVAHQGRPRVVPEGPLEIHFNHSVRAVSGHGCHKLREAC